MGPHSGGSGRDARRVSDVSVLAGNWKPATDKGSPEPVTGNGKLTGAAGFADRKVIPAAIERAGLSWLSACGRIPPSCDSGKLASTSVTAAGPRRPCVRGPSVGRAAIPRGGEKGAGADGAGEVRTGGGSLAGGGDLLLGFHARGHPAVDAPEPLAGGVTLECCGATARRGSGPCRMSVPRRRGFRFCRTWMRS